MQLLPRTKLQVNFGIIEPTFPGSSVVTKAGKNLLMKVTTQDPTGTVELWLREKAALELSGCATMDVFVQAHSANAVTFPFLCSFRVHIQQPDSAKQTEDRGGSGPRFWRPLGISNTVWRHMLDI